MKNRILLLVFTLFSIQALCQSKNSISLVYGIAGNDITSPGIGSAGYAGQGEMMYGLNYIRRISKSFSIETGLEYSVNKVLWDYEDAYDPTFTPQKASIKMLSVPVFVNFTFLKYLYANAGLMADFETSHQSDAIADDKSGIGLSLGIGGKYNFNNITIFVNPFLQAHSFASFHVNSGGLLLDQGVKFGIGYRF